MTSLYRMAFASSAPWMSACALASSREELLTSLACPASCVPVPAIPVRALNAPSQLILIVPLGVVSMSSGGSFGPAGWWEYWMCSALPDMPACDSNPVQHLHAVFPVDPCSTNQTFQPTTSWYPYMAVKV
ncbi:hypothetical protein SAY87_019084 [Trapa incisa]|uniref:Uncharacterized protein n=1 Tax=Trapa incisa TaxID=236973 RepID=A0AAN7JYN2_9MYRT|nr:hypothetical protein SAY87_019084 [Trapa incisa]